ncbi:Type I Iterative PKS [Arachnomyces sp. PD_36]|nr:Type I Iterative PKS [Arachnomyces sp. PD_36]
MSKPINLVLFGDQNVEKLSSIQSLVRNSKTSAGAKRLLREATDALQLNISKLSKEDRSWNHEIQSLLGLAEDNVPENNRNGLITTVLMCIGRLGELIVYAEEDPSILGSNQNPVQVLAFCTGLLPAAALVAARDPSELFDIGIEIISITFRMAYEIFRRMKLIEDTKRSWAVTVIGKTPQQVQPILDEFHKVQNIPYPKRIAIGVISDDWLTLSGAPSSLSRLMEFSEEMNQAPKTQTETDGVGHTQYMPKFDVDMVLGDSPVLDTPITSKARIISPGSCKEYNHTSLRSILAEIMVDIAHNILHINETVEQCVSHLADKGLVSLAVVGPTSHLTAVQRILQDKGIEYQIRRHRSPQNDVTRRGGSDLVAIVGMSGRFPGSETIEGFFEDLLDGKSQIKKISKSRFDLDRYFDSTGKKRNTTSTQDGAFLDHPGHFDNRLFNISPREASQMDPIQRLLLMTSYEALQNAGYSKDATLATESNRIATYFGQASEDWRDILNNDDIDIYYLPSLARPFGPSRLSYHHKWGGGTYALDAACATSTTAIHLAVSALNSRECDTAVAGGGSILVSPNPFAGLSRSGIISDNGGCRTYHDDADGYVRGEGIGVVVLKRLEDAYADNDNILGVIRGSARTYTSTSTSITHPSAESQSRVYDEILRQTGMVPNEIAYVEMHGTGTQAGDSEEMTSVINTMGQGRSKQNTLTVGAVKANVGHGEGAAGITSLFKVLMMMREQRIPPQPGLPFKLNRNFPKLDKLHVQIAGVSGKGLSLRPSPVATDGKIKCVVNSFDASGGNTSLVVEEAPKPAAKPENPLPCHVVCISAKTITSLKQNRRRLLDYLMRNPSTKLADLAYTTTARRMHEVLRVAYSAKSTREITSLLQEDALKEGPNDPRTKPPPVKVVFTFTGQGSQYGGMGRYFYQHSSAFRNLLHTYQEMGRHQGLPDFIPLIVDENTETNAASVVCVQLSIVALEVATAQILKTWGIIPDAVMGHSLGEYSALCVANVLSVSDTLFLVGQRAHLMEKRLAVGAYSMLAISKNVNDVRQLLDSGSGNIDIACINAPQVTVVSGSTKDIIALQTKLEEGGSRATVLKVPYGFHSQHVEPILDDFATIATGVTFSSPTTAIASTLLGEIVPIGKNGVFSSSYLTRQAREHVNFVGAIEACKISGFVKSQTHWVEIGPEPVCMGLVRKTLDVAPARLLPTMKSKEDNWFTISSTLAALYRSGASINWPQYYKEFESSLSLLALPTYAFDVKDFWTPYVEHIPPGGAVSSMALEKGPSSSAAPSFSTTSLQWIEQETLEGGNISVIFASYTSEPSLYKAIRGHVVNGNTVCSLSIFCDMAKSAAQYAYQKLKPAKNTPMMSIFNVDMTHALVVPGLDPGLIVKTIVDYPSTGDRARISFRSTNSGVLTEHGSCDVVFEDNGPWFVQQSQTLFLMNARIQSLRDMSTTGKAHRLLKPVIYRLFDNLVTYSKDYQGLEEVWIDAKCHDAVGTVKLPKTSASGNFLYNPFWIDAATHLAGFLLNGGLKYEEDIACLSTGFGGWRTLHELQSDQTYTTYVNMQEADDSNTLFGSAYVFNSDHKLVQVTTGIKFMKLKKLVLNSLLRPGTYSTVEGNKVMVKPTVPAPTSKPPKPFDSGSTALEANLSDSSLDDKGNSPDGTVTQATSVSDGHGDNLLDTFLAIVASESGYNVEDMEQGTAFADMGMDSLMGITILATIHRDTGVELPATFLLDNPTVGDAKVALLGEESESIPEPITKVERSTGILHASAAPASQEFSEERINKTELPRQTTRHSGPDPAAPIVTSTGTTEQAKATKPPPESKAILLQGSPSSTGLKLFLLPDGSGSPSRYIQLPTLGTDTNVYALESPFLKSPKEYTCNLETICNSFVAAIRAVKPTGPFNLAGYSLGAIYAYDVARQLLQQHEQVDSLILVDMAVPRAVDPGISPTHEQVKDAGFIPLTGRQTNSQKEHVARTVQAMIDYRITPSPPSQRPRKVVLVSSKSGLGAGKKSDLAQWAQGNSSASRGWEKLVGPMETHEIEGEHFSLFRPPAVNAVAKILSNTLESGCSDG